jgi:F-type H+-transporting ATPase subunit epsilon
VAEPSNTVQVEVVTPDGVTYEGAATLVVVPGTEGQFGVMAGHEPIVALLAIGETRVRLADGVHYEHLATGLGYIEVLFDRVRIVCDHAELAERIDRDRAEDALRRAEQRLAAQDDPAARAEVDFYRAEQALRRARNRLEVTARRSGDQPAQR